MALQLKHYRKIADQCHQIEVAGMQFHLARFDPGQIKNVIDHRQQMMTAPLNRFEGRLAFIQSFRIPPHELRVPENGVHRCADLMTHIGKKQAFRPVGCIGRSLGFSIPVRFVPRAPVRKFVAADDNSEYRNRSPYHFARLGALLPPDHRFENGLHHNEQQVGSAR